MGDKSAFWHKLVAVVVRCFVFLMNPRGMVTVSLLSVVEAAAVCLLLGWAMRWGEASTAVVTVCTIGMVVVVGMCICWLIFSLRRIRALAARWRCDEHLARLADAMLAYARDKGRFPGPDNWCDELHDYSPMPDDWFRCPRDAQGPCSFAMNSALAETAEAGLDTVILFESKPGRNNAGGAELLNTNNHRPKGANIAFADGRVKFIEANGINNLKWKPEKTGG